MTSCCNILYTIMLDYTILLLYYSPILYIIENRWPSSQSKAKRQLLWVQATMRSTRQS